MTVADDNKALVLRFIDALDRGDIAGAAECFDAERYCSHAFEADLAGTWEQQKAAFRAQVWSDVETERVAVLAEGDRVMVHSTFTGTHTGPFLGLPASGARVSMPSLQIWRIADGKIVEHWGGRQVTEHTMHRLRDD
jgi:predicted ester cyclase